MTEGCGEGAAASCDHRLDGGVPLASESQTSPPKARARPNVRRRGCRTTTTCGSCHRRCDCCCFLWSGRCRNCHRRAQDRFHASSSVVRRPQRRSSGSAPCRGSSQVTMWRSVPDEEGVSRGQEVVVAGRPNSSFAKTTLAQEVWSTLPSRLEGTLLLRAPTASSYCYQEVVEDSSSFPLLHPEGGWCRYAGTEPEVPQSGPVDCQRSLLSYAGRTRQPQWNDVGPDEALMTQQKPPPPPTYPSTLKKPPTTVATSRASEVVAAREWLSRAGD